MNERSITRKIFNNAAYSLFAIALFFGVLANTIPNFVVAEWCEVIAFMGTGAAIWEIFRQLKNHESGGGKRLKPTHSI